jgi:hypothetical protein
LLTCVPALFSGLWEQAESETAAEDTKSDAAVEDEESDTAVEDAKVALSKSHALRYFSHLILALTVPNDDMLLFLVICYKSQCSVY